MPVLIKYTSILFLFFAFESYSAQITNGVIMFERKTNLIKKYKTEESQRWLRGEKVNIDRFYLYFTPTKSLFIPIESLSPSKADWATSKNTVIQDFNNNERTSIYNLWGENMTVIDKIKKRTWKITERKRDIAGYSCRRAIWEKMIQQIYMLGLLTKLYLLLDQKLLMDYLELF